MFTLLLALSGSEQWRELKAKPVRWTRNAPRTVNIPAGGQSEYKLRHKDPEWEGFDDVETWLNQPLQVRVRLRILETPEAADQGVVIGECLTQRCLSMPPHSWLTGPVG